MPLSSVCVCVYVNIFKQFSETTGPIEAKFHMEPPWDGRTKVCSNGAVHMTKMTAMPLYGKNIKNLLLRNQKADNLEIGMHHRVLKYYQISSNVDPGLILTYFMVSRVWYPRSLCIVWLKCKTMDFSETIVVYDVKIGICS